MIPNAIIQLLRAASRDVSRNPAWYSIVALAIGSAVIEGINEHRRIRALVSGVEQDLIARRDEIQDRMARASASEHDAPYDRAGWGETSDG